MHTTTLKFAAALLALAPLAASAHHDAAAAAAVPAGSAVDCWKPAFLAGDADAVAACYAEDAVMIFPSGPLVTGRAAIRDGFAGFLGGNDITDVQLVELGRSGHGDEVTTWGTFAITMVDKASGAEMVARGRFTDVSRRIDGQWRYVLDHASDDPPPPAPPAAGGD